MKKGKEVKLVTHTNFNIKIGTVDNRNPKSVFINITAWGEPKTDDELDYNNIIGRLNKRVRQYINDILPIDDFYINKVISELDMKSSGIRVDKRSFMALEITLYQRELKVVNKQPLKGELHVLAHNIINNILEPNEFFNFYKSKTSSMLAVA